MIPNASLKKIVETVAAFMFFMASSCCCCYSQKQGNVWYFARQLGLDFNNTPPNFLTDCQIDYDDGGTEGSASIASKNGDLLFYANGETIWNRKHEIMRNGDGLLGHRSSTNGAVIIPVPGENAKYYVFNTHAFQEQLTNGLRYCIVDMCGDNGYGEVIATSKNTLLLEGAGEKLAFTEHVNGIDYWLVAHRHFSNAFYAYLITENGIAEEVISEIGTIHGDKDAPDFVGYQDAIGQMKFSPDGSKLALVMENRSPDVIDLFDFNASTGKLSTYKNLSDGSVSHGIYGVSFSPDNSKLYFSGRSGIFQLSLDAGNGTAAEIIQTKFKLADQLTTGGLQLGPDGKIYISRFYYAALIEYPNLSGNACNFIENAVYLGGGVNTYAFPTFLDSFDYPDKGSIPLEVHLTGHVPLCPGELVTLDATSSGENVTYLWPDGSVNPGYTVSSPGDYTVKIQDRFCTVEKTIEVTSPEWADLGPDIKACDGDVIVLSGMNSMANYIWQNGSTDTSLDVDQSGIYWADVTKDNCTVRDSINVTFSPMPKFSLGNDTTLCEGQNLELHINIKADLYKWNDGSESSDYEISGPGDYSAEVTLDGCSYTDFIKVSYDVQPVLNLGLDTLLCYGTPFTLSANKENTILIWSDGSSQADLPVNESGIYWADVFLKNCSVRDSVNVGFVNCSLVMPNIFTPNGDKLNPNFIPMEMNGIISGTLIVYNRWGQEIFRTSDLTTGWDGNIENIESGIYLWEIRYQDISRSSNTLKGTVTLNR